MRCGCSCLRLAYNLANFLCLLALPDEVAQRSLTTLRDKLVKIGLHVHIAGSVRGLGQLCEDRKEPR